MNESCCSSSFGPKLADGAISSSESVTSPESKGDPTGKLKLNSTRWRRCGARSVDGSDKFESGRSTIIPRGRIYRYSSNGNSLSMIFMSLSDGDSCI